MSCKSCSTCQDLVKRLEQHLSTIHSVSGAEGVIVNVVLNLLALVVTETSSDELTQLNQSVPVISKPSVRQVTVIHDADAVPASSGEKTVLSSFPNEFSTSQISNAMVVSALQSDSQLVQTISEAKTKDDHVNLSQSTKTVQQMSSLLEFPFVVQQGNEMQAETIANSLVNSDGTLTPVGISLLLSNQANRVNATGKSDLDDVADILVNKMPIPSLKGLDSNFQQISNFYLQQLALTKLQALTSSISSNTDNSLGATTNTPYTMPKDDVSEPFNSTKPQVINDHTDSLQNILERHKQISSLIEAMNIKTKETPPAKPQVTDKVLPQTNTEQRKITVRASKRQPSQNTIASKQTLNNLQDEDMKKISTPNQILINATHSPVFLSKNEVDGYSSSTSEVHFSREKKDSFNLNNIQNLIMETAKRMTQPEEFNGNNKMREESQTEGSAYVDTSHISKVSLGNSQGILIDASKFPGEPETSKDNFGAANDPISGQSNVTALPKVLYKCEHCGVTFSVLTTLSSHIKLMHGEKLEFCNYCQISFTSQDEYFRHLATHKGEENIYSCQFCDKIFTSNGDYRKHVIKHTQKRPYSCGHCQKSFRDPGSLAKHERIHTGEQPFVCEVCNRGFAEKSSLRKHSRVHSGEKPYSCQLCEKSFSISGNLQRHMLIHTGKRPFKCTVCTKAFNNPSHLRRHIRNLHSKNDVDKNGGESSVAPMETPSSVV